jgi:hypothetical protein
VDNFIYTKAENTKIDPFMESTNGVTVGKYADMYGGRNLFFDLQILMNQ